MKGNAIVLNVMGRQVEGIISGTPKPGTMMQIKAAVEPVGGRLTYEVYAPTTGDGTPRQLLILDIDHLNGKTWEDAYVSGRRGFMRQLIAGDEVNVRKADISGTSSATEDIEIGERLLIVDGTGKISPVVVGSDTATTKSWPFVSMETLVDQPAETCVHCQVTGY